MKRLSLLFVPVLLLASVGCTPKPVALEYDKDKVCKTLHQAGYVAAVLGLKTAKVDPATDLEPYKVVCTTISEVLAEMPTAGFSAVLPEAKKRLEAKYGTDNKAYVLAGTKVLEGLLGELEDRLQKNPKWVTHRDDLAEMLASFLDGAVEGIEAFEE